MRERITCARIHLGNIVWDVLWTNNGRTCFEIFPKKKYRKPYLELSKRMSYMLLNMSRTTSTKFEQVCFPPKEFDMFGKLWTSKKRNCLLIFVQVFQCIFLQQYKSCGTSVRSIWRQYEAVNSAMCQKTQHSVFGKFGSILGRRRRRDATTTLRQTWDYLAPPPSHPGTKYLVRNPLT